MANNVDLQAKSAPSVARTQPGACGLPGWSRPSSTAATATPRRSRSRTRSWTTPSTIRGTPLQHRPRLGRLDGAHRGRAARPGLGSSHARGLRPGEHARAHRGDGAAARGRRGPWHRRGWRPAAGRLRGPRRDASRATSAGADDRRLLWGWARTSWPTWRSRRGH